MTLIDIISGYTLIFGKFDQGFLLLLLGILDRGVDEYRDTVVRLLLQMGYEFRLEYTPDDGIAFFACSCVNG